MSASCCMILSPVASSSSKPLAISWRILASWTGVSRTWPVADDCSVSSFRSLSSRSSCAWRLKSSSDEIFSRALLEFERRGWCSCSDSDSSVSDDGSADLFYLFRPLGLRSSQILAIRSAIWPIVWSILFKELKLFFVRFHIHRRGRSRGMGGDNRMVGWRFAFSTYFQLGKPKTIEQKRLITEKGRFLPSWLPARGKENGRCWRFAKKRQETLTKWTTWIGKRSALTGNGHAHLMWLRSDVDWWQVRIVLV